MKNKIVVDYSAFHVVSLGNRDSPQHQLKRLIIIDINIECEMCNVVIAYGSAGSNGIMK